MTCFASKRKDDLLIETWSGSLSDLLGCQKVCTLVDGSSPTHLVRLNSRKTYTRKVTVRGLIEAPLDEAKFVGPQEIVMSSSMWQETRQVDSVRPFVFSRASISKTQGCQLPATVLVRVEIDADDMYRPGRMERLDTQPIRFPLKIG